MAKKSGWSSSSGKEVNGKLVNPHVLMKYKHDAVIAVGIHEDAPDYEDGTDLSLIANFLEYGTEKMPEYRWLQKSIEIDSAVYTEMFIKALKRSKDNKAQFDISMDEIGKRAVNAVQQHLERNDIGLPDNMPSTQRQKGGNSPIINTRHLVRNIDFKRDK